MMKYFTGKYFDEDTSDKECSNIRDSNWEYLKKVSDKFSNQIYNLAFNTNLHDGIIFKVINNKSNSTLELFLRIGDLQHGYDDLHIKYLNIVISKYSVNMLKKIINDKDLEILYDEISLNNGNFIHSLLLSNYKEVDIEFGSLEILKIKVADRSIKERSFINKWT